MTTALDIIRYHSGIAGEEVADMVDSLEQEVSTLREQVEKLTKERDTEIARNRPLQSLIKSTEETKSFLLKKSEENKEAVKQLDSERQANAVLTEELAALAEQNEKMREFLKYAWQEIPLSDYQFERLEETLSLPDLATPVLNRIRAEALNKAAKWFNDHVDNRTDTWQAQELRRMAAELKQTEDFSTTRSEANGN